MILTQKYIEKFHARFKKSDPNQCWKWIGCKDKNGYGRLGVGKTSYKAHRISYFVYHKKQPGNLCVCHKCDNPSCVNPDHLFLGTIADNTADMIKKGRRKDGGKPHPGERNGRALITEKQAKEIIALAGIMKHSDIEKKYRIGRSAIQKLMTGKSWKHLKVKRKKGARSNIKKISYLSASGKVLKVFNSAKDADEYFDFHNGCVWRACKEGRPTHGKIFEAINVN